MKTSVKELFDLTDKVAIITGGAGLLGEKHAEAIAEFGGIPVLLDINEVLAKEKARKISSEYEIDCVAIKCDITNNSDIENVRNALLNQFGKVDILINNAANDPKVKNDTSNLVERFENLSLNTWNTDVAVGLTGAFLCSQIFGAVMAKNGGGVILNISSDLGIIAPDQRLYRKEGLPEDQHPVKPVTYSVIKHGLIGLTKYLATYWADKGIRVNTLCPAGVFNDQPKEFVKNISELIPLGRMANINEYKAAIVFLTSSASSYMNGATLVIDGGRTIC